MALVESDSGDDNEFTMLVRRPTAATRADLAGNWRVLDFGMADDLTENYYNVVNMGGGQSTTLSDSPGTDEIITDVFFRGGFETLTVPVSLAAGGAFSGAFSGTFSTTANGTVSLAVAGEGTEVFTVNASGNVMVRTLPDPSFDEQRFTALVKLPDSLSLSELAGAWRFVRLWVPNRLVEVKADGRLTDVSFPTPYEVERGVVGIGTDGSLAAAFSGSIAVSSPGVVTVTADGAHTFYVNDTKDVMLHVSEDSDGQEIIALLRVPLEPTKLALDSEDGKLNLLWAGRSDVKLQKSSTLTSWSDAGSTGQSAFESSSTTAEFYRLIQLDPE